MRTSIAGVSVPNGGTLQSLGAFRAQAAIRAGVEHKLTKRERGQEYATCGQHRPAARPAATIAQQPPHHEHAPHAGQTDLESSIYLAFTNIFITADKAGTTHSSKSTSSIRERRPSSGGQTSKPDSSTSRRPECFTHETRK
jgi:hypothetical protein